MTEWTTCGGCAAKWGAGLLSELVRNLPHAEHGGLLVGLKPFDDAAVVRLSDELALVSTTDFFPPVVDDPFEFGAIAAANACSDVFAMGARVIVALNLAAFPEHLPSGAIAAIFEGAARTVVAAGGTVAGGHTIRSDEPIFGLAVQGLVHPERILTKGGAAPGDVLMLSKPLGTGIVLAGGTVSEQAAAIAGMRELNRASSEVLVGLGANVHALTDVTGYGLLGHAWEMAERSGVTMTLLADALPAYPGALRAAANGTRTGGDPRNREYLASQSVHIAGHVVPAIDVLAHDPQTSGGLLAAVDPAIATLLEDHGFWRVGTVEHDDASVLLM